jgi:homopolymeric O-antigen transport system permease protein
MKQAFITLFKHRQLLYTLVVRELKARYRGSILGFFWSFANPLLLLIIYTIVFSYILEQRDPDTNPYSLFLFCGILPWTWFTSSLLTAANSVMEGGTLIKKILFPAEVLPFVSVISNLVHFLLGLPILFIFMIIYQKGWTWNFFFFPVIIFIQLIFTLGLGLYLSALSVHFRDIKDLLANFLTLWFFTTPIIYPNTFKAIQNSQYFKYVIKFNPMTYFMMGYQKAFFYGEAPSAKHLLIMFFGSVLIFLTGYSLFDRVRDSFAEEV